MADLVIEQFPCRQDNFGVLIHDPSSGLTAAIDAPDAAVIEAQLAARSWQLTHIFITHHHVDHTAGNVALKAATGCRIVGPKAEADRIPGIDEAVGDGDSALFGRHRITVIETPGHTAGHVTYYLPTARVAFTGDTLFAMGCGRLFEGNAEMMWQSLNRLKILPPDTQIYCGHEYTLSNARFAQSIDPDNPVLQDRVKACEALRASGKATLPTRLDLELATNPFLRAGDPAMKRLLGMDGAPAWQVFAELRRRKDRA